MNKSVLVISDQHIPYHHPDLFKYLEAIKKKYKPDRIINIGDEADKHALSFHNSDSELYSAGDELKKTIKYLQMLAEIFPKMDLVESNHGSMHVRKAKANGIPLTYFKTYNEIYDVPKTWKWHPDLIIKLSNGQKCYFCHGKIKDSAKLSQTMGMNAVQGHYHESLKIEYWASPIGKFWGMNVGCLISDKSMAFAYNKVFPKRPIEGLGIILNGYPHLLPMILKKNGRWNGVVL